MGVSFLTFAGSLILTFCGLVFLRLGVTDCYVWGLVIDYVRGLVLLRFEVSDSYVRWLVFLRLGVSDSYV